MPWLSCLHVAFLLPLPPLAAAAASGPHEPSTELASDDECVLASNNTSCTLNALQHRGTLRAVATQASRTTEAVARRGMAVEAAKVAGNASKTWAWSRGPPKMATSYNGIAWDEIDVSNMEEKTHVFAIGDWGGMDGSFEPGNGHIPIRAYPDCKLPGPHVFPRSRRNCPHMRYRDCYTEGRECPHECGFMVGVDENPQLKVAEEFIARAAKNNPEYILNVGDNFYWGGIELDCGWPMGTIHENTAHQFNTVFEGVYNGPGLTGKKWLSVLGNHDWGGFKFTNGWDQQIAYTWESSRWVMPALYYSVKVNYPTFTVEYFMIDTNVEDAKPVHEDPPHNICGQHHNPPGATCRQAGGPRDVQDCPGWFASLWQQQKVWLERGLAESTAGWQIVVTHFPCGFEPHWFRSLNERFGLDLLVTGHRHDQELWHPNVRNGYLGILGNLTCFVTGGGGGITSEDSMNPGAFSHGWPNVNTQYGFFDLTISQSDIFVESIDYNGNVVDSTFVIRS